MEYFSYQTNIDSFLKIMESWYGTPYMHGKAVKGRGVDCTLLIGECLKEAKILTEVKHVFYPEDWVAHTLHQFLLESLYNHWINYVADGFQFAEYKYTSSFEFMFGDIIVLKMSGREWLCTHAVIYLGNNQVVQSIQNREVGPMQFGSFYTKRIYNIFRIEKRDVWE